MRERSRIKRYIRPLLLLKGIHAQKSRLASASKTKFAVAVTCFVLQRVQKLYLCSAEPAHAHKRLYSFMLTRATGIYVFCISSIEKKLARAQRGSH